MKRANNPKIPLFILALFLHLLCVTGATNEDSLRNIIDTSPNAADVLLAKIELAKSLSWTNTEEAKQMLFSVSDLIEDQEQEVKAKFYNACAIRFWFDREYDSAIAVLSKTIALENNISDGLLVEAINNTGTLYNILGKSDSSARYLHRAVEIDLRRNELNGLAKSYYDLGTLYKRKDHLELAVHFLHEAAKIQEKIEVHERLIRTLDVTASLYARLKDTSNAQRLFTKALRLADSLDNSGIKAILYSNYSYFLLNHLSQPKEALSYAMKSVNLYEEMDESESGAAAYVNLGSAYLALGEQAKGIYYYRKAIHNSSDVGINGMADLLSLYASVLLEAGEVDSAIYYNEQAAMLINQIDTYRLKSRYYQNKAMIDSAQSDYKSAFENLKLYRQFEDSALNNEHLSRIEELKIIHQIESRDKENQQLRHENVLNAKVIFNQRIILFFGLGLTILTVLFALYQKRTRSLISKQKAEIVAKNTELIKINKTKDKFISIIAHDLRSPFHALLGSLDLLIHSYKQLSEEETAQLLKSINESSKNTYNMLVNLLEWTIAQKNGFQNQPQLIDLHRITQEVLEFLETRAKDKHHQMYNLVDEHTEMYIDPNIIRNILVNLINNAIKFTPEGGEIKIIGRMTGNSLHLSVQDNGMGIPPDKQDKLFTIAGGFKRKGTNNESGTGLGLILIKEFIDLLGGSIMIESKENEGSTFNVQIPNGLPTPQ